MITNLKCEYETNPIGIDSFNPVFSWIYSNNSSKIFQSEYRIIVKKGEIVIWDSNYIKSAKTYMIEYDGEKLKSFKRYTWSVFSKTNIGEIESEKAFFVTGILDKKKYNAKWIMHPNAHDNPILYRDVEIYKEIKEAYIAISGLGFYELSINSIKAHDTVLVPSFTDYKERSFSNMLYPYVDNSEKRILYNTYDVKDNLKNGFNELRIELGNGMFGQDEKNIEGDFMYGCPRLWMVLYIEYEDETVEIISSDEEFFASEGALESNNIYYGEKYNNNIGLLFDYKNKCDIVSEYMGVLYSQYSGFDRVISWENPVKISKNLYEVKENMTGWCKISAKGERGAKFKVIYFEELNEDLSPNYYSCGGEWQIQKDEYIFGEEKEIEYAPKFTWHGFKYFIIEKDDDVKILEIKCERVHADVKIKSTVSTDNQNLNWLYKAYINTQTCNYHQGIPSDCPHRERLGYTGDGHITIDTSLHIFDSYNFYKKWNKDIIASQNQESGFVPHTVPFYGGGGGPTWGVASVIVPYTLYQHSFDKRILEESIECMKGYVQYLENHTTDYIVTSEEEGSWCLGDWCIPVEGYDVEQVDLDKMFSALDPKLVNTCYFYRACEICETTISILGEDPKEYTVLKNRVKRAINDNFLNEGKYSKGEYGANIYPLYFNIVPVESKDEVVESLLKDIEKNNYKMTTGIFATSMICDVLIDNNHGDYVGKIFNSNEKNTFGFMRESGASTIWETWDKKASINHPMFGGVCSFIFKYLAGIKYINNKNEILIKPEFNTGINDIDITYNCLYGEIKVKWNKGEDGIKVNIVLPHNVRVVFVYEDDIKILDKIDNSFIL